MDEPNVPHPPRFRWLIRLSIAYVLLIALLVTGWFYADRLAQRRLDEEIARLQALGQPVLAADFNALPAVPDGQNAALLLKQAMNFKFTRRQEKWEADVNFNLRLTDAQWTVLHSFPVDFAANLQQARATRQYTKADWGQTYASPLMGSMLPSLSPARQLANLLQYSAIAHHLDGNDAEAIECIRDILHLSKMIDVDAHSLVEHLVSVGISAMACDKAFEIGMEMGIDGHALPLRQPATRPATQPARPASRQQVRALIAELLDEKVLANGFVHGMEGEQAMQIDTIDYISRTYLSPNALTGGGWTRSGPSLLTAAFRPMFRNSATRMSGRMSQRVTAAREANHPAVVATLPPSRTELYDGVSPPRRAVQVVERILEPSLDRMFTTQFRELTGRRATAARLAIRLYQLDHAGELPPNLEALVPSYLPAVPVDPFSPNGSGLRYVKSMKIGEVETPVVYSVGEDGKNQNASTQPTSSRRATRDFWTNPHDREDLLFPLKRPPVQNPPPPDPEALPEALEE